MRDKIYPFICKANQIIFFLAAVVIAGFLLIALLIEIFGSSYQPPQVKIIDDGSSGQAEIEETPYEVNFAAKIKDVFIFKLTREYIVSKSKDKALGMMDSYSAEYSNHSVVNMLFVESQGENRKLFDSDVYITEYEFSGFEDEDKEVVLSTYEYNSYDIKIPINLYSVISSDSNNDGFLNEDDDASLFRSDYAGESIQKIIDNVLDYQKLDSDTLLIGLKDGEYFEYSISESLLTKLDTEVKD